MIGTLLAFSAYGQSKLPPCPKIDYSINMHHGADGRTEKWHNCFGRYKAELNDVYKDDVMEGEWRNGSLNGQGIYYFLADNEFKGDKYVGEFKDNKLHGLGTYTYAKDYKYVGEFKYNKRNGKGTFYYLANSQFKGDKYVGEYKDDKKNGQGTYTYSNGEKYVGEFKDSNMHGQGTYTYANGRIEEGIWVNNQFIRAEKITPLNKHTDLSLIKERRRSEAVDQRQTQALVEDRRRIDEAADVTINFEFNSAKLSPDSQEQLSELAKALNNPELKDYKFKITGHTDAVGSDAFNLTLSKRRAGSVLDYLASRYQVSVSRLVADGMGKRLLKYPNDPKNGGNRRVEITQMGKP